MAGLQQWARETADKYDRQISRLLGVPVTDYEIVVVPPNRMPEGYENNPGVTLGTKVYINASLVTKANEGVIIHELVHAMAAGGRWDDRKPEQLADWVRWKLGGNRESDGSLWKPSAEIRRFDERIDGDARSFVNRMQNEEAADIGSSTAQRRNRAGEWDYYDINRDGKVEYWETAAVNSGRVPGNTGGGGSSGDNPWGTFGDGPGGGGGNWEPKWEPGQDKLERRNTRGALLYWLQGLGIQVGDDIGALLDRAAKWGWDAERFAYEVRKTPEYRERFPGIFDKDGTLKMSEAQYIEYEGQFQSYASQAGINLGDKRMAWLFRHDVRPDEFADRAVAMNRLNRDRTLYKAFGRELVQGGLASRKEVDSKKELFRYIMGEKPKAWYDLWQDTVTRNAAVNAGIEFGKGRSEYVRLGRKAIERISGMDLSEEEMRAKFQEVEGFLRGLLTEEDANAARMFGVNNKTITKAVFGGKNASAARGKLQRALETADAFDEDRANTTLERDSSGRIQVAQGRGFSAGY